jgi:DNA-binding response OmpR family regulator
LEKLKKIKIAFLEDDVVYATQVIDWLKQCHYDVHHFVTGMDFLKSFSDAQYDLCLFDSKLPDISGSDVMSSIRLRSKKLPPIVFLTGIDEEEDIVRVIASGADDYIIKPVSKPILLVRINAILRRLMPSNDDALCDFGALKIDTKQRVISLDGETIKLTDKEFDLAVYFLRNEGALLSRVHLMQVVWGSSAEVETRKVDVHVSHLRSKLKLTPEHGWKLTSIYQQGYRLERSLSHE